MNEHGSLSGGFHNRPPSKWAITVGVALIVLLGISINQTTNTFTTPYDKWFVGPTLLIITLIIGYREYIHWRDQWRRHGTNYFFDRVETYLSEQLGYARRFHARDQYFKLLLAHFRAKTECNKFVNISKDEWVLRALPMWEYFLYVFSAILMELGREDEYLTVSVIEFWAKDRLSEVNNSSDGFEGRSLLKTNYQRCSETHMRSTRLILVNKDRIKRGRTVMRKGMPENELTHEERADQLYFEDFEKVVERFAGSPTDDNFINLFYVTEENEYDTLRRDDVPFALVKKMNWPDRLCISTFIPDLHTPESEGWRVGLTPKIGFRICKDEKDEHWRRMYSKFDLLQSRGNDERGRKFAPADLLHRVRSGAIYDSVNEKVKPLV